MSNKDNLNNQSHRYLVITELFLPTKGGTAVWFDEVYQRIGGKEIHIVTKDVEGGKEYDKTHKNTVHRVSLKRHWWLRPESLAMYLKLFFKSLKVALTNKIDAVHTGRVLPEGLVGLLVARIIRKPLVIYAHGEEITTWRQSTKFKVMKFTYQHADKIIANSEFTKGELEKIGIDTDKIIKISPGVNIERFRPMPIEDVMDLRESIGITQKEKLILSVGRLSRRKGFDQTIKALAQLREDNIDAHYALIGIGEDKDYLQKLVKEYKVNDYVHFLGHVSMEDLPRWHNAADVFVMPNREIDGDTEGFGMVFVEAAACGKPVIAGNAGGTGDAVINEETGYRIDATHLENLTQALSKILLDESLAEQIGKKAYERATKNYNWNVVAKTTTQISCL
ncbi:MAG TPA: glycosyltransferase family 4 protein [Aeromonadales bacterium]|nr:glycosyltransferase family 4 protein [Aeromonadales bacterium]